MIMSHMGGVAMQYVEFDDLMWANSYLGEKSQLTKQDFEQLKTFTFMWDMFEAKACKGVANAQSIADFVWGELGLQRGNRGPSVIDAYFSHFYKRYVDNKSLNANFEKMSRNTQETFTTEKGTFNVKEFIGTILLDEDSTEINKMLACLLIIYRWRCNFFLLNRDQIKISTQYRNFNIGNKLIASVLQKYRKISE